LNGATYLAQRRISKQELPPPFIFANAIEKLKSSLFVADVSRKSEQLFNTIGYWRTQSNPLTNNGAYMQKMSIPNGL
jgi:hypothetical protein